MSEFSVSLKPPTRRTVLAASAAAAVTLSAPAILRAATKTLTFANSGGAVETAFKVAFMDTFEKKTGVKVISAPYLEGALYKSMVLANSVTIDVCDTDATEVAPLIAQGLVEKIDYSIVPTANILPTALHPYYVIFFTSATVIGWNTSVFKGGDQPKTWQDFFDPKQDFQRALWNVATQTIELAALGGGQPANALYPIDLDLAFKTLDGIKKKTIFWSSGAQSVQLLIDDEADSAMMWNGRVEGARRSGAPVDYSFNQALLTPGTISVPKGVRDPELSMRFVANCLDPENQATFCTLYPMAPANEKVYDLVDKTVLARMPTSPQNDRTVINQNLSYWIDHGAAIFERYNSWLLT
jgi:putative spermidine/putrescine transport system substrate-binding protein